MLMLEHCQAIHVLVVGMSTSGDVVRIFSSLTTNLQRTAPSFHTEQSWEFEQISRQWQLSFLLNCRLYFHCNCKVSHQSQQDDGHVAQWQGAWLRLVNQEIPGSTPGMVKWKFLFVLYQTQKQRTNTLPGNIFFVFHYFSTSSLLATGPCFFIETEMHIGRRRSWFTRTYMVR